MTKRDFLILMIKLFGMYSAVITLFSSLPGSISFSFGYGGFEMVIWLIVTVIISIGLFWLLTFKADKLVDLLHLDKGFADDRIELGNIKSIDILRTGVLIIGGLMVINGVPALLSQAFWAFRDEIDGQEFTDKNKFDLGVSVLNVLLGYLLFSNYDVVAGKLNGKKEIN